MNLDINDRLAEYGLTPEKYEEILKDCYDKANKIKDVEWSDIIAKHGLNIHYDTLRKASTGIFGNAFVSDYYKNKESKGKESSYINELKELKDEIYKEKRKLYDQRREYNKQLTAEARSEHLNEELIAAANKLNKTRPLFDKEENFVKVNTKREALLCFSDWHYGMTTDNVWNTYNTEICRERIRKTVEYTIGYLKRNDIDMLSVVNLGDIAHGSCHVGCRVESEEYTCDQLMNAAEILAEAISELSKYVNYVEFYSCYGNHMRTIQNKKDSIDADNMEKIVPWWLEQRFKNNPKVGISYSDYKEFTLVPMLGYNVVCTHGNLDNFKNLGLTVNTLFSKKFGKEIDYTISGDKHHLEEFEQFGIESILIRSLCGADEYASTRRLYSKPGQTLMIFNNKYGRESTYHIPLE